MPLRTIVFLRWFERYRLTANYNLLIFCENMLPLANKSSYSNMVTLLRFENKWDPR